MKLINLRSQLAIRGRCSLLALAVCFLTVCSARQTAPDLTATPSPSLSQEATMASPAAPSTATVNADEQIESIRQQYVEIKQKLSANRVVEGDLSGFSAEGGSFKAYLDGQTPRLIAVTLFGETGRANEEFYFDKEGALLFVFRLECRYDKPFGKPSRTIEQRFYFHAGNLIRWLNPDNQPATPDQPEFAEQEKQLLNFARTLMEKARR